MPPCSLPRFRISNGTRTHEVASHRASPRRFAAKGPAEGRKSQAFYRSTKRRACFIYFNFRVLSRSAEAEKCPYFRRQDCCPLETGDSAAYTRQRPERTGESPADSGVPTIGEWQDAGHRQRASVAESIRTRALPNRARTPRRDRGSRRGPAFWRCEYAFEAGAQFRSGVLGGRAAPRPRREKRERREGFALQNVGRAPTSAYRAIHKSWVVLAFDPHPSIASRFSLAPRSNTVEPEEV